MTDARDLALWTAGGVLVGVILASLRRKSRAQQRLDDMLAASQAAHRTTTLPPDAARRVLDNVFAGLDSLDADPTEPEGAGPWCDHDHFTAYHRQGSVFDDHVTEAGYCHDCGRWLVVTRYHNAEHVETRRMTEHERAQLKIIEDQQRHEDY